MGAKSAKELAVYLKAYQLSMSIFEITKRFPNDERFALVRQIRRSSRSVCLNLREAWAKRRYRAHFVSKLSDCEAEAAETQVWIEFAVKCGYIQRDTAAELYRTYDEIIGTIVGMITHPETWIIK